MDPQHCALILMDLQNDYLHPQGLLHRRGLAASTEEERADQVRRVQALLQGARQAGAPVVWVRTAPAPGPPGQRPVYQAA